MRLVPCFLILLLTMGPLQAREAMPLIEDPVIELRMKELGNQLRCLVCQGQSVVGSDSDFSRDVRREMRRMMEEGKSDQQVVEFLVARYGDFILFEPPVKGTTYLLWFGPLILFVVALVVLVTTLKRRRTLVKSEGISNEDIRRAEKLLEDEGYEEPKG
ncbi:MAG: cytochrome c-type biogenesis protein CcmH [Gammaproteobacteria bacterium]